MRVLAINEVYGRGSTGTIVRDIGNLCELHDIECYVASPDLKIRECKRGYHIGNVFDRKLHAVLGRINGKQAYFSYFPTKRLLRWIDTIKPDIIHLHNLHGNYINLNMLLKFLAKRDIRTLITFHDCWYFTGGCFHYTSSECFRWHKQCGNCPRKHLDTISYFKDCSSQILADRKRYLNAIPRLYIIGASEWIASECRQSVLSKCNIDYIHNGFNLDVFKPTVSSLREQYGLVNKFVLLAPASKWYQAVNRETLDYFIRMMDDCMALVIFGCSHFNKKLPRNVYEIGYMSSPQEIAALYSMGDVLVNCTREDTLPSINIECQATGTPVVTFDSTGCKETVNGICSKAVPVGNYKLLFEEVQNIRALGKKHFSASCISWVHDNFELNDSYIKYINIYKRLFDKFS